MGQQQLVRQRITEMRRNFAIEDDLDFIKGPGRAAADRETTWRTLRSASSADPQDKNLTR
jgi:hypothetical protein